MPAAASACAHLGRGGEEGLDRALAAEPQRRSTAWLSPVESLRKADPCQHLGEGCFNWVCSPRYLSLVHRASM